MNREAGSGHSLEAKKADVFAPLGVFIRRADNMGGLGQGWRNSVWGNEFAVGMQQLTIEWLDSHFNH